MTTTYYKLTVPTPGLPTRLDEKGYIALPYHDRIKYSRFTETADVEADDFFSGRGTYGNTVFGDVSPIDGNLQVSGDDCCIQYDSDTQTSDDSFQGFGGGDDGGGGASGDW